MAEKFSQLEMSHLLYCIFFTDMLHFFNKIHVLTAKGFLSHKAQI